MRCEKAIDYEKTKLIMKEEFKLLLYNKKKKKNEEFKLSSMQFFLCISVRLKTIIIWLLLLLVFKPLKTQLN